MNRKRLWLSFLLSITGGVHSTYAEESKMKGIFYHGRFLEEANVVRINNPIRVRIKISNTAEDIQKQHRVVLHIVYENPTGSGEAGVWNNWGSWRDLGLFSEGQQMKRGKWLPTEQKPKPLADADFIKMQPGEKHTADCQLI